MNNRVIILVAAGTIVALSAVLFFVLGNSAQQAQLVVFGQAAQSDLDNEFVTKGLFSLGEPSYADLNMSCSSPYKNDAYVNVILQYNAPPRSCEVFVNDRIIYVDRSLEPSCIGGSCQGEEYDRTFHLGEIDIRDDHSIQVCCNSRCITKEIDSVCSS